MSNVVDMLVLLALGASVGLWLKSSAGRERAVREARALCQQYDLQLLDETVGLRRLRLRRINGLHRLERCYDFEVSVDGHDRKPGHLWMIGNVVTDTTLPAAAQVPASVVAEYSSLTGTRSNVVVLSSRRPGTTTRLP